MGLHVWGYGKNFSWGLTNLPESLRISRNLGMKKTPEAYVFQISYIIKSKICLNDHYYLGCWGWGRWPQLPSSFALYVYAQIENKGYIVCWLCWWICALSDTTIVILNCLYQWILCINVMYMRAWGMRYVWRHANVCHARILGVVSSN